MRERDLAEVMAIESAVSASVVARNFADFAARRIRMPHAAAGGELVGYFILMVAAGEAPPAQFCRSPRRTSAAGAAAALLRDAAASRARSAPQTVSGGAASNLARRRLYTRFGFPGSASGAATIRAVGREDALVLTLSLQ